MRVHVIRHASFEGPEEIADWARLRGHEITESFAVTEEFPSPDVVDFLVVLGGPMDADDAEASPWLVAEKRYIADVIQAARPVLGVCLGSQILAEIVGGTIRRAAQREIGFFPLRRNAAAEGLPVFAAIPDGLVVGHWHGDTFDLPNGVSPAFSSEATPNQAFALYGGRVVGLQCHLEWTAYSVEVMIAECGVELSDSGRYVMSAGQFLAASAEHLPGCHDALFGLLDEMARFAHAE